MLNGRSDPLAAASRLVVLSPHLDDAVLSCGAVIARAAEQGVHTTIATIFNGSPDGPLSRAARHFHALCGHGDDAMAHREIEDDLAVEHLGVKSIRLGLPEALYRRDASGRHRYTNGRTIFRSRPETEMGVAHTVIERLLRTPAVEHTDLLLAPLGIGNHIDHQIISVAARCLRRPVLWYEDIPYALYDNCRGWQAALAPTDPVIYFASDRHWQMKLDAAGYYASQHPILWEDSALWREVLTKHATSIGGDKPAERYWGTASELTPSSGLTRYYDIPVWK